jgi:hypothetical protein
MSRRRPFNKRALAIATSLGLTALVGAIANAHPELATDGGTHDHSDRDAHQHGDRIGHLPGTRANIALISKLQMKNAVPEKVADVSVHKGYAYLAAWGVVTCKGR